MQMNMFGVYVCVDSGVFLLFCSSVCIISIDYLDCTQNCKTIKIFKLCEKQLFHTYECIYKNPATKPSESKSSIF